MKIGLRKLDHLRHQVALTRRKGSVETVELDTKTFFLHDICHYFVEKELEYKNGFWGMLANGHNLDALSGKISRSLISRRTSLI